MIIRPAQLLDIEKLSPLYAELGYPVKEAELVRRLKQFFLILITIF